MVIYDLEAQTILRKAEWRYAMRDSGEQCVMISGGPMMLKWHADNLDSLRLVCLASVVSIATFCELKLCFRL